MVGLCCHGSVLPGRRCRETLWGGTGHIATKNREQNVRASYRENAIKEIRNRKNGERLFFIQEFRVSELVYSIVNERGVSVNRKPFKIYGSEPLRVMKTF